jgi:hypothetical protein
MSEGQWHPESIGRLTLPQILCLGHDRPPRDVSGIRLTSLEDRERYMTLRERANRSWELGDDSVALAFVSGEE